MLRREGEGDGDGEARWSMKIERSTKGYFDGVFAHD
jgi:hypothetical protein